ARARRAAPNGRRKSPAGGTAAERAATSPAQSGGRTSALTGARGSVGDVREESQVARALDRHGELPLVEGGGAADPARQDLRALGHETGEELDVLEVDVPDLLDGELADAL